MADVAVVGSVLEFEVFLDVPTARALFARRVELVSDDKADVVLLGFVG